MDKRLIEMAKRSERSYAETIKHRNEMLLEKLELLKPFIGVMCGEIPTDILYVVLERRFYGCPHCTSDCKICLWSDVVFPDCDMETVKVSSNEGSCFRIPFQSEHLRNLPSVTLETVEDLASVRVFYYRNSEQIRLDYDKILTKEDYDKCLSFILGHIDWANLLCWGEDYMG